MASSIKINLRNFFHTIFHTILYIVFGFYFDFLIDFLLLALVTGIVFDLVIYFLLKKKLDTAARIVRWIFVTLAVVYFVFILYYVKIPILP